jgi:Protein of unknown function (DUF3089)
VAEPGEGRRPTSPARRESRDRLLYVYPTVSGQPTGNSNLVIGPAERSVALYQAARYSENCRVYAPMYRQVTLAALGTTGTAPTTCDRPGCA